MDGDLQKDDLVVHEKDVSNFDQRMHQIRTHEITDTQFGYQKYTETTPVNGFLLNFQPSEVYDSYSKTILAATDFYFLTDDEQRIKISYPFRPYLYLGTTNGFEFRVAAYLEKKYPYIKLEHVEKEDLDLKNHLSGLKSKFLFISFPSTVELAVFKKDLFPQIRKNQANLKTASDYTTLLAQHLGASKESQEGEPFEHILDIREYDLPYHMRVCIDEKIFAGLWYTVIGRDPSTQKPSIKRNEELIEPPDPVVCAYDIETTKLPLKFPDRSIDQIMMISYMIDGHGFLIINRQIVSEDIGDFEYTPRPEFKGEFRVFNEKDEKATLRKFFDHILKVKPHIMVTYNGDFFDWPFVEARAAVYGMNMTKEIGFAKDNQDEYKHISCIHMDAYRWVKRDSYLPVGSQNLKATTKAKLRYDPVELDPELMVEMAEHQPQTLASYSVSDAVSTYYLYMKYVHPFIFALCTIIPLGPDDVLRKGSGTLCEALLMVEAFHKSIIFPNKQIADTHKVTEDGKLLESETYVGAHVEALESGVFRSNIACRFRMNAEVLETLKAEVKATLEYSLVKEMGVDLATLTNLDEVVEVVQQRFDELIATPTRTELPKIYHLDVGAMYPNIILTNRLQPPAIVKEEDCLACVYNTPDATCKRDMNWAWRGEVVPASKSEYERIRQQLEQERFNKPPVPFHRLPRDQRNAIEKKRLQDYCKRAYGRAHITRTEIRTSTVCERENGFYVNTVLAFRDRRYDYKAMLKKAKTALAAVEPEDVAGVKSGQNRVVLYESLQLAHKCILNSFYGYAMRKGSRWFSMEMAGIVCHTGANIITEACQLVEKIGRPLELDTDGIWCLLPDSFPENYKIKTTSGKDVTISYPGAMLNAVVKDKFTNDQYHNLKEDGSYEISSENTIFFEVDGPYLAMILPASKEEGKKLKKRYAVFNFDKTLAELKGFEVKRRGELNIIKEFQKDVFKSFLNGDGLEGAYACAAKVADNWLDILFTKGADLRDEELFDLIAENRSMSKKLEEYGNQKSTSITTAKRLAEFLGAEMVQNAGLACRYVISRHPAHAPVAERAIPLAIFQASPKVAGQFLSRWCGLRVNADDINIRELLDWPYYIERLGSCIQKIITIPAALQGIPNPVPRVPHPDWLENLKRKKIEAATQPKITDVFKKSAANGPSTPKTPRSSKTTPMRKRPQRAVFVEDELADGGVVVLDAEGNPTKRPRMDEDDDPSAVPVTPRRHVGGLGRRPPQSQPGTPSQAAPSTTQTSTQPPVPERKTWSKDGFHAWLKSMKKHWARLRADRRAVLRQGAAASAANMSFAGKTNLERMIANFHEQSRNDFWHIVQVNETQTPGVFDVFAVADGRMQRFSLTVPRLIYVNDLNERQAKRVYKNLPKMQPCFNLYEYAVKEANFVTSLNDLTKEICSGNICGIYESEMPLLFRVFVQVGATCRMTSLYSSSNLNLDQLERVVGCDTPYIDLEKVSVMYFYEFTHTDRTVCVLIYPKKQKGFYFVVNRGPVPVNNLDVVYKTELDKFRTKQGEEILPTECEDIHFETVQKSTLKDVAKELQKTLQSLRSSSDPTVVALQSSFATKKLFESFPVLKELPHVRIHITEPSNLMHTLDWANVVAKRAIQRFFNSFVYLADHWKMAHYVGIPVGNIPEDISSLSLDVLFARALQQQNHILWASPNLRPDLGGKEAEDLRLMADWDDVSFKRHHGRILNVETFGQKSCVAELEIGAVAVTALIQNVRIVDAEGCSDAVGFANVTTNFSVDNMLAKSVRPAVSDFDEAAQVSGALRVLRQVFHELIRDIHTSGDTFADQLVVHMYRWMCDPKSLLYNPAICRGVNILMRKLCLLLATEITRLGGTVIHCSFSKLVVATNRADPDQSSMFIGSVISTLSEHPLFASLQIVPLHLWNACLWLDPSNFAAVSFREDDKENTQADAEVDERVTIHFTMVEELPERVKNLFDQIVTGYLLLIARQRRQKLEDEAVRTYATGILRNDLAPRLFEITDRLVKQQSALNKTYRQKRIASDEEAGLADVPLDFVKTVCKVLSLDENICEPMESILSQLALLLGTNIGSSRLEWRPPVNVCVLENLFCGNCSHCIDLDLCAALFSDVPSFRCPHCLAVVPNDTIEGLLMQRLNKMANSYSLQDRVCTGCKQLARRLLSRHCECSNKFAHLIPAEEYKDSLVTLHRIAKTYELRLLELAVQWKLDTFPGTSRCGS